MSDIELKDKAAYLIKAERYYGLADYYDDEYGGYFQAWGTSDVIRPADCKRIIPLDLAVQARELKEELEYCGVLFDVMYQQAREWQAKSFRFQKIVRKLIDYRDKNQLNFQIEKANDFIDLLAEECDRPKILDKIDNKYEDMKRYRPRMNDLKKLMSRR